MSREIKFRAWQDNQMVTQPLSSNYGAARFFGFLYEDVPVMQYTGLLDKNGKEIYEGDILNNIEAVDIAWRQVVEFETGAFWRKDISKGDDSQWEFDGWETVGEDWEVIGNIYENPELLDMDND